MKQIKSNDEWKEICKKEEGFPIWKYHKIKKPSGLIVYSSEELKKLGSGWVDSPADFDKPEKVEEKPSKVESKKAEEKLEAKDEKKSIYDVGLKNLPKKSKSKKA